MRASRRVWIFAVVLGAAIFHFDFARAQQTEEQVIANALGPQWKQISHRAGLIFAGTVLSIESKGESSDAPVSHRARSLATSESSLQVHFRIDEPIAGTGTDLGHIFTMHEWSGAWAFHRPLHSGQRVLIFLYPVSRLGFTSPVGGSQGVFVLDPSGTYISPPEFQFRESSSSSKNANSIQGTISVGQLKRAIRQAREE